MWEKNPIKSNGQNYHMEEKEGKAKERPNNAQPKGTKEGRELVLLVVGSYFTQRPFNVTRMQIMKYNSIRRSRTKISC
jgi:hypothetical protein